MTENHKRNNKPRIVLVHGAFADGTGWQKEARVMAAAQKPIFGGIFQQAPEAAAWKSIPSWYLLTTEDNAINPDLERFYAKRIGATTVEIASSHAVFVSHPQAVVKLIEQAAKAVS